MEGPKWVRRLCLALTFPVVAALVTACGGTPGSGSALPAGAASSVAHQTGSGKSWMRPGAKSRDLLYVGDTYTNDVFVYDYPSQTLEGTLTGFDYPQGMCVDKKGDVFITNAGNFTAAEYAHGGTSPLQTINTGADSYPVGCAVSPRGDLAISDWTTEAGFGAVLIYKSAHGTPKEYSSDYCHTVAPGGYDEQSNLWFQGEPAASGGGICELPRGAASVRRVTFNATIYDPGSTTWDGRYIALTDIGESGGYSRIFRATASGRTLTEVGSPTNLTDTCIGDESAVSDPFIIGSKNTPANRKEGAIIVGPNGICIPYGIANVRFWNYPAGGNPAYSLPNPPAEASGVAVSVHRE